MPDLANRLGNMAESGTAAVFARVSELRRMGVDILSLSVGEPDFATPAHIVEAAAAAMRAGETRYTEVPGTVALRDAILEDSARRRGVRHGRNEVVVCAGAKHALFQLAEALYDPGDRVLVPTPCWGSYVEQARLFGAEPVFVPATAGDGFAPDVAALERELARGAKALVLCSPNNPTGAVLSADYLKTLAELLRAHDCFVIVDEIYAHLTYDVEAPSSLLSVAPDLRPRLLIVDGVSKAYAMTGFRVGWLLAPAKVSSAVARLQGQATSNVSTVSQAAALAALTGDQGSIATMRSAFQQRRDRLVQGLEAIQGIAPGPVPAGAFYVLANVESLLGRVVDGRPLSSDSDVATFLIERARVATVPGSAFFAPGYLRFSYAQSLSCIEQAIERIGQALSSLA